MTAFRLFSKLNTFYGLTGQLLAGGSLKFYDAGTTTPRDVYGELELTTNNGATVALDSSGRPNVDVWGDGAYFVEAYDSLGVKQGEADNVEIPGGGGLAIPALTTGQFLTNNGAVLLWSTIREVPDPTGQGGKVLGTDGENLLWQTPFTADDIPAADQTIGANSARFGNLLIQWGSGSVSPATIGVQQMTSVIAFPASYDSLFHVSVTPNNSTGVDANSPQILPSASVYGFTPGGGSASSVTVLFTVPFEGDIYDSGHDGFHTAVPYTWFAIGTKAAA